MLYNQYNVRARSIDGSPLNFSNIYIYENDSLAAYAQRLAAAGVTFLDAVLTGTYTASTPAPVFHNTARTAPAGSPTVPGTASPPEPRTAGAPSSVVVYGAIAIGLVLLLGD